MRISLFKTFEKSVKNYFASVVVSFFSVVVVSTFLSFESFESFGSVDDVSSAIITVSAPVPVAPDWFDPVAFATLARAKRATSVNVNDFILFSP